MMRKHNLLKSKKESMCFLICFLFSLVKFRRKNNLEVNTLVIIFWIIIGIIMTMHAELYKGSERDDGETCYLIVLATRKGTFKLDMVDDLRRYKTWSTTINHMLKISTSFAKYHQLQFYWKLCYNISN